jgi:membrane-associated protease RseP (regulator of RpoE activity)
VLSCEKVSCDTFSYEKKPGDEATFVSVLFTNSKHEPFVPLATRFGTFVYTNAFKPGWGWLGFIYGTLALSFVLNFLIGSVNLMPIPMFDGHRLFSIAVPNPLAMRLITYAVALAFVLNLLPWAWA